MMSELPTNCSQQKKKNTLEPNSTAMQWWIATNCFVTFDLICQPLRVLNPYIYKQQEYFNVIRPYSRKFTAPWITGSSRWTEIDGFFFVVQNITRRKTPASNDMHTTIAVMMVCIAMSATPLIYLVLVGIGKNRATLWGFTWFLSFSNTA